MNCHSPCASRCPLLPVRHLAPNPTETGAGMGPIRGGSKPVILTDSSLDKCEAGQLALLPSP